LTDGETVNAVMNYSSAVRIAFDVLNASDSDLLGILSVWSVDTDEYILTISNTLPIGTHTVYLEISYDYVAPFYGSTVAKLTISIRKHSTEIRITEPAAPTGFGLDTIFQLEYIDLDTGGVIIGASLSVDNVTLVGHWIVTPQPGDIYEVTINTTAFLNTGSYWVLIVTQNTGGLENL
jgi:hypothetical protein